MCIRDSLSEMPHKEKLAAVSAQPAKSSMGASTPNGQRKKSIDDDSDEEDANFLIGSVEEHLKSIENVRTKRRSSSILETTASPGLQNLNIHSNCLLYTSPSPRDQA
eukprot:TRINITY_DN33441_c0_g1_i1.p1 TRINITY_DN33441_c0_g1~~TRINITY_DN33441_c0_g1_i1.p1  ORF type:complete len:122 (+),score=28.82 TRINITY_DN33441_c0_g1_i1:46-366(+)